MSHFCLISVSLEIIDQMNQLSFDNNNSLKGIN